MIQTVDNCVEVDVLSSNMQEIVVKLPRNLIEDLKGILKEEKQEISELIVHATKSYVRAKKEQNIQESMQRGYLEMAKINLNIASESFLAEEEADLTVKRLVSGV